MPTSAEPTSQPSFSGLHTLGHYPPALITPGTASSNQRQLLCPQIHLLIQSLLALLLLILPMETTGSCPQCPLRVPLPHQALPTMAPSGWQASLGTVKKNQTISSGFSGGAVVRNLPAKHRGNKFNPWSRKVPHAMEQLSTWAQLLTPRPGTREATAGRSPHAASRESPPLVTRESPRAAAAKTLHSQK